MSYELGIMNYALRIHLRLLLLYLLVVDILIVSSELVDGTLRSKLYDAVSHGVDELMVMAGKDNVALEVYQIVVECLNAFQVEVVW